MLRPSVCRLGRGLPQHGMRGFCKKVPDQRKNRAKAFQPGIFNVPPAVEVPLHIARPSYANHPKGLPRVLNEDEYGEAKHPEAIARMRRACRLAAETLAVACDAASEGVTTDEVDRKACEFIIANDAYPVGINYHGFPRGLCASPNEVAIHGVPNNRPLQSGDIVNFDVTVYYDGAFGDCSMMVCVGDVDKEACRLVDVTKQCLYGAIEQVGPGVKLNAIGSFCKAFANKHGFGVVSDYCGHFIGSELHMKPNVLHVPNGNALELRPGMTFTIEPIVLEDINAEIYGPAEEDGWSILSKTGCWSAQWEHTVLVTEHGAEILTLPH